MFLNGAFRDCRLDNAHLLAFLREHPEARAVSSYHLRPPKPETTDFVFFDAIFVRHPLDRLYAMLQEHSNAPGQPATIEAHTHLQEYAQHFLATQPHFVNDAQVNYLANGGAYLRPPGDSDLVRATQLIRETALLGTVRSVNLSLTAAEYYLQPVFPGLDLSYVNPHPCLAGESWRSRVDRLQEACGVAVFTQLQKMNSRDLELFRVAEEEVCRRFEMVPDRERRLSDFVSRCQASAEFFLEHDRFDA